MADQFGRDSRLLFGEDDTTWGTAGTVNRGTRIFSDNLEADVGNADSEHLFHDDDSANNRDCYQTHEIVEGTVAMPLQYERLGLLYYHALGSSSSSGSGPYTHTHILSGSLPSVGITLESARGVLRTGTTAQSEIFPGGRVTMLRWVFENAKEPRLEASFIAKKSNGRSSITSVSLGTFYPVRHFEVPSVTWNSVAYTKVKRLVVTLDNKLERNQFLGSLYTDDPVRSAPMEITVEAQIMADTDTLYASYRSRTTSNLTFTATDSVNSNKSLGFTVHNALQVKHTSPRTNNGPMYADVTWKAYSSGTPNMGLTLVNINAQSSYKD